MNRKIRHMTGLLLGIALLPLVFYHAWQLLVAGFVKSSRLVREGAAQ